MDNEFPDMDSVDLPIERVRASLLSAAGKNCRWVLTAPTGAGKSTQVPQMLLDGLPDLSGCIVVLQPRRLAARMLARRVASERGGVVGGDIGFQVRFQDRSSAETRILYVTEGLFWRRILGDPELRGVGAVLFDEFHERNIAGDLALVRVCQIQRDTRPDLLMGVMSATLETDLVEKYLEPCEVLRCEGRSYPVRIQYSGDGSGPGARPVWEKVSRHLPRVLAENPGGNLLVFMPGAYEIRKTVEAIQSLRECRRIEVLALHGDMPPEQQDRVLERGSQRKVIVATNVAETSLTIDGVMAVVDSGLVRVSRFDSRRGVYTLLTERISLASADQRSGRAGRLAPGYCLRLWKEEEHSHLNQHTDPEVRRIDLAASILEMRAGGIVDPVAFPWLEKPAHESVEKAEKLLQDLGAVNPEGLGLTADGHRMAAFPVHPRYARLLLEGEKRRCLGLVAQMAAFVQGRNFLLPLRESRRERERQELLRLDEMPGSDFFYLYKAFQLAAEHRFSMDFCRKWGIHATAAKEAWNVSLQFLDLAKLQGMAFADEPPNLSDVCKCLLSAFPDQIARRLDRGTLRCVLPGGRRGELRRQSVADGSSLLVVAEIEEVKRGNNREILLGLATEIQEEWLSELFPDQFQQFEETIYEEGQRRVLVREVRQFGELILGERFCGEPDGSIAAELLSKEIQSGRLSLKKWDDEVEQWIQRVGFLAMHCPVYGFSPIDEEARSILLQQLCLDAFSYREVKSREVWPVLKGWLASGMEPVLDNLAPVHIEVPGRRKPVPIRYKGEDARVSMTVQELMGIKLHPTLANGNYILPIEVLAPNRRPVQVTTDLIGFWRDSYPDIRRQFRGRYPKHHWPENPDFS